MKAVKPEVYLVTRPAFDWEELERFLKDDNQPPVEKAIRADNEADGIIETSARLCYDSYLKGRNDIKAFIKNLMSSKDGSVFEHVNYGFLITGISRSLSHQFVRHRAGFAYSQRSQRYVDEVSANYVLPPVLEDVFQEGGKMGYKADMEEMVGLYKILIEDILESPAIQNMESKKRSDMRKKVWQAARSVLPNAMETKMFVTANVRAWRHFLETRLSFHADDEIRRLAFIILEKLQKEAPLLFGDFETFTEKGVLVAEPEWSKI